MTSKERYEDALHVYVLYCIVQFTVCYMFTLHKVGESRVKVSAVDISQMQQK